MVSTHLKNIRQNGNLLQVGVNIKHIWNHHLDDNTAGLKFQAPEAYDIHRNPTTSPSSISVPGFCPRPEAPLLFPRIQEIGSPEREFVGVEMVLLGGSSQWTCLITMVIVSPLRSGLFQMAFAWHINGGDPNYLIIGMALQEFGVEMGLGFGWGNAGPKSSGVDTKPSPLSVCLQQIATPETWNHLMKLQLHPYWKSPANSIQSVSTMPDAYQFQRADINEDFRNACRENERYRCRQRETTASIYLTQ